MENSWSSEYPCHLAATLHSSLRTTMCLVLQDTTRPPSTLNLCSTLNESMYREEEWLCWWCIFYSWGGRCTCMDSHHCLRYAGWRHLAMSHAAGTCRVRVNCGLTALGAASDRPVLICSCVLWFMSLDLHPPRPSLPALHSSVDSEITRTLSNTRRQKR